MRLFVAINFTEEFKDSVEKIIDKMRSSAEKGNFTRRENQHLTLVFLGEVSQYKLDDVKNAMDAVVCPKFDLNFKRIGKFKRDGGDIYWIGSVLNNTLTKLQHDLSENLRAAGFDVENRTYRPHLTIGREVVLKKRVDNDDTLTTHVGKISLMQSERLKGVLTYTEIYAKELD